jgi:hypothetical protein
MEYPIYKKNGRRHTCIIATDKYIEVKFLNNSCRVTFGDNSIVVDEALNYDSESNAKEFNTAYLNAQSTLDTYLKQR